MSIFKKKLSLIANVFPKLRTCQEAVRQVSKNYRLTVPFAKLHGKRPQTLFKFSRRPLYDSYWSLRMILSLKNSLLLICKMWWLFVNTFTANGKYSHVNRDNLRQSIQKQLSQNRKTFSEFFSEVLTSGLNIEHFQKKVECHSSCISEITDSQKGG